MRTAREKLEENVFDDEDIILIDEEAFKESLVGVSQDMRAIYDYELMAKEFSEFHGCDIFDARDYIDYNIINGLSAMGNKAPIIMDSLI